MQDWGEACDQSSWKTLDVLKCKTQVPSSLHGPTVQIHYHYPSPPCTSLPVLNAYTLPVGSGQSDVPACEVSVCSCLILPPCLPTQNLRVRSSGGTEFFTRSATKFKGVLAQKFMFVDGDRAVCGSYR
jgi:hypothetical protein